jgi:membrane-associated phospholipid phosphatase
MDIQYLLFLQGIRDAAGGILTPVMLIISHLATIGAGVLCVVLFWGIDREMGYWVIINSMLSFLANNLIKLTACVYRPWIRDARIEPPERALRTATGYSFPSGHTQFAASSYGSLAQRCGRGRKVLYGFCAAMIFLAAFSRNYLGVHTPQDVIVAILCSFAIIKFCAVMESKVRENPALLDKLLLACCVIAVLCAVYFHFKSYPMDYEDGRLIVDPQEMKADGYSSVGAVLGTMIGMMLEKRFVRFRTDGPVWRRVIRVLVGLIVPAAAYLLGRNPLYALIGKDTGHLVLFAFLTLYAVWIYPAIFTAVRKRFIKEEIS